MLNLTSDTGRIKIEEFINTYVNHNLRLKFRLAYVEYIRTCHKGSLYKDFNDESNYEAKKNYSKFQATVDKSMLHRILSKLMNNTKEERCPS